MNKFTPGKSFTALTSLLVLLSTNALYSAALAEDFQSQSQASDSATTPQRARACHLLGTLKRAVRALEAKTTDVVGRKLATTLDDAIDTANCIAGEYVAANAAHAGKAALNEISARYCDAIHAVCASQDALKDYVKAELSDVVSTVGLLDDPSISNILTVADRDVENALKNSCKLACRSLVIAHAFLAPVAKGVGRTAFGILRTGVHVTFGVIRLVKRDVLDLLSCD